MRKFKKLVSMVLALFMAVSLLATTAFADTSFEFTYPEEPVAVDDSVLTTMTQRAGSEIPLIFGLNVVGGNMFTGLQDVGGTVVNENPDPYVWNYNYMYNGPERMTIPTEVAEGREQLPEGTYYQSLGNTLNNPNGLYNSGGANQNYSVAMDELGGVGYAVGFRNDVIVGFNSVTVDQIDLVHSWKEGDEFYRPASENYVGDKNYSPLIIDVQTGSVTSRLYSWTEMGQALSAYLAANPGKTTRYGDPYTLAVNLEEFCAGIPYYIASQIASGAIEKKTAAYVSAIDGYTLTCVDPAAVGAVGADTYAQVHNFNFLSGSFTLADLMDKGVDVIMLAVSGYGYTSGSVAGDAAGGGTGGTGGNGGGQTRSAGGGNGRGGGAANAAAVDTSKQDILAELAEVGYGPDEMPLIMSADTVNGVTIGTNGFNYAPTTPLLVPHIQAYAYMDALAKVNPAINPVAMLQYALDEFCHVEESAAADVALYYIGSSWDSVDEDYDQVPDLANYVYDKDAIASAIKTGITYALSGEAEANGNTLLAAVRTNDNAYLMLTQYAADAKPADGHDFITVTVGGKAKYLDLTDLAANGNENDESGPSGNEFDYYDTRTEYQAIIDYYNSGKYGYGDNLQTTLQKYADRMVAHVWSPDTSVEGTYGYGLGSSKPAAPSVTPEAPAAAPAFSDVAAADWYAEAVTYASSHNIMNGKGSGIFDPDGNLTRAEMCEILRNLAGKPAASSAPSYGDVAGDSWYAPAVAWCCENGIAVGRSDTEFAPEANITREEVADFLYRYAAYQGKETPAGDLSAFTDAGSVSASTADAMSWAAGAGIITGAAETTLAPNGTATRAQIATMMMRFCEAA